MLISIILFPILANILIISIDSISVFNFSEEETSESEENQLNYMHHSIRLITDLAGYSVSRDYGELLL